MKKLLLLLVCAFCAFQIFAQVALPTVWDFSTPTASFNTLYYIVFGVLTVVIGQLAKKWAVFNGINTTVLKVAAAAVPVIFIIIHFGMSAGVVQSIYSAVLSLFVGAGIYSGAQSLKD